MAYQYLFPVIAYLIGSISSAIIVSKLFRLNDPRKVGSGNAGATNVLRSGNKFAALLTLIGDVLKGAIPVWLAQTYDASYGIIGLCALAALLGHIFPVYFNFKGGKGVATCLGIFIALMPLMAVIIIVIWLLVAAISRYSSLAALIAAAAAIPMSFIFFDGMTYVGVSFALVALLMLKHRDNIDRLKTGTESKISFTD
ncbi:MAG TPA: acyl-phosphate glycerol 3-phosphate acyltransferase [Gammaproteobacteria bacterium]|jgi:acyl phosphate:glycerol-3-phosphate acyltransferase|nr:acyl-phosphate glycerol 3-phosphate acyltransferase [Gammaproteobacteria bacterium]